MRIAWKIFRAVVSGLLLLAVLVPTALYVLLSMEPVQSKVRDIAETELTKLLGADISIERVNIHPFNRLAIDGVGLTLPDGSTPAAIDHISAGFELRHFLQTGELIVDYVLIDGITATISRESQDAPLNIQPIIDHLRSDKPKDSQPSFELKIDNVVIRNGCLSYDVNDAAEPDSGRFDPRHIFLYDLAVNAYIPTLSNNRYSVDIDHLSFLERSGLCLSKLQCKASAGPKKASLESLIVDLPSSHLAISPLSVEYDSLKEIEQALRSSMFRLSSEGQNYIYLPDLSAFAPVLARFDAPLAFDFDIEGSARDIDLRRFTLRDIREGSLALALDGSVEGLDSIAGMHYTLESLSLLADGYDISAFLGDIIPADAHRAVSSLASIGVHAKASGTLSEGSADIRASGTMGNISISGKYNRASSRIFSLKGRLEAEKVDLTLLTHNDKFGFVSAEAECDLNFGNGVTGSATADISEFDYGDYTFSDINIHGNLRKKESVELTVDMRDPNATVLAYAFYNKEGDQHDLKATLAVSGVDFNAIGLDRKREGYRFGFKANADIHGTGADDASGMLQFSDIRWADRFGKGLRINRMNIESHPENNPAELTIESDIIKGSVTGDYHFGALAESMKTMLGNFVPAVFPDNKQKNRYSDSNQAYRNKFSYSFTLPPSPEVTSFFGIPLNIIHDASMSGNVDTYSGRATLEIDAPYLSNGDKLIENTNLFVRLDTLSDESMIYVTTQFPTNKGDMAVTGLVQAIDNRIDTRVDWLIQRRIPLNGSLSFSTLLHERQETGAGQKLVPFPMEVDFNPGTINFGDETWTIKPSHIKLTDDIISVSGFGLNAGSQAIAIDGNISHDASDSLDIDLQKISLLPIFETLEIDKALISGRATGRFVARDVLTKEPSLECGLLHVDSIGYNRCTIGDADIKAGWNNTKRSFYFDADITGPMKEKSRITGDIFPFDEALDIDFHANHVPVGFLRPFMEAFTSDISGYATGHCRLFGTFKEIDLEGRVFADNVKIKIDFINASYTATDSVYLDPGVIRLKDITIHDPENHTAKLNGTVRHTFFKEPVFRFDISDARDMLVFNGTSRQNPDWYGTIYGNGTANISGYPGVVNITANMSTARRSTFTFVLSDRLDAENYSFINFRDATPDSVRQALMPVDDTPALVRQLRNKIKAQNAEESSAYNMDIRVDITKDASMTLVMDPVAGDEIKATGEGNMHLAYHSIDNNLNIWGVYKVLSGSYRFTLQDIIIRDFTIKEGSEIRFDGDPYAVKTDLSAYYATNANLSDLDESFLQDKDISRTNVPVHALMLVSGVITQPEIKFDLEFPTLTHDTYRKVRSIVSTEDMMNRQIIYLLALNRFYTPDYMASTTKGSELFSVASSTISSQLGNMLGKLSENWSIAPNLRSDRGDFSDVEVDVALSSRLLNNRLLFNGNFGYRDKSLNTNQFIGDFDIEYLLNQRGSWRLKAYNRYNDRNYYVRSAQTTQGVGIMFRRDFDDFLSFLRKFRQKEEPKDSTENKEK